MSTSIQELREMDHSCTEPSDSQMQLRTRGVDRPCEGCSADWAHGTSEEGWGVKRVGSWSEPSRLNVGLKMLGLEEGEGS